MAPSRPLHAVLATAFVAAAAVVPAMAATPTPATSPVEGGRALSADSPVLDFHGKFANPTPLPGVSDPLPAGCAIYCDEWTLRVRTSHSFLVSVRNTNRSMDDGLNLFVDDPAGHQVAAADGVGADGQAVTVAHPVRGVYTVWVTVSYAYDQVVAYQGEARIMAGRSWQHVDCSGHPCPLLPRLRALPPSDLHVDGLPPVASTPLGFPIPIDLPTTNSCYTDETAATGAARCLRFTSDVRDVGAGQLYVKLPWLANDQGTPASGFAPGGCHARQIIDWTDGRTSTRPAGPCEFHLAHGHFHYKAFVGYGLYAVDGDGRTGGLVSRSQKESFCLADDDYAGFGTRAPNGPRAYAGQPGCNVPETDVSAWAGKGTWVGMGLNPGWGDVYTWDTPDQYIDISSVPAGIYDVIIETNPSALIRVAGPARTCAATRIRLTPTSVKELSSTAQAPCPSSA
jgi:hypothetical protein